MSEEEAPLQAPAQSSAPAEPEIASSEGATEPVVKETEITNGAVSNGVEAKESATDGNAPVEGMFVFHFLDLTSNLYPSAN